MIWMTSAATMAARAILQDVAARKPRFGSDDFSKLKWDGAIEWLEDQDFVESTGSDGRYRLTNRGREWIKESKTPIMKQSESLTLEGDRGDHWTCRECGISYEARSEEEATERHDIDDEADHPADWARPNENVPRGGRRRNRRESLVPDPILHIVHQEHGGM